MEVILAVALGKAAGLAATGLCGLPKRALEDVCQARGWRQFTRRLWVFQLPASGKYHVLPLHVARSIAPKKYWASKWLFTSYTQSPIYFVLGLAREHCR